MRFFTLPALLLLCATSVEAQRQSHLSIDGTLGLSRARSGIPFKSISAIAMDAMLAARMRKAAGLSLTAAANVSRFYKGGEDADCRPLPGGGCAPGLPNFSSRSLLLGFEALTVAGESIRVMVGPTWVWRDYADTLNTGLQTRLDLATHMTGRLGLVVSGRWSHLPDFRGRALNLLAFGCGFRLR